MTKVRGAGTRCFGAAVYLVDNLGSRYPCARDSLQSPFHTRQWPPQIPVELWLTFAKTTPGASSVSLILPWQVEGVQQGIQQLSSMGTVNIVFRRIPFLHRLLRRDFDTGISCLH